MNITQGWESNRSMETRHKRPGWFLIVRLGNLTYSIRGGFRFFAPEDRL
ncbi:MAG: hypothetical protein ACK2TW_02510 [Anaerolineales bacterium]